MAAASRGDVLQTGSQPFVVSLDRLVVALQRLSCCATSLKKRSDAFMPARLHEFPGARAAVRTPAQPREGLVRSASAQPDNAFNELF